MSDFDRLFLIVMPSINVALGIIGVSIGVPAVAMAWTCGFAIAGDVAIFGLSRLWTRLGRLSVN
jgi:hypothetical protein